MKKQLCWNFSFCLLAVIMILVRPCFAGAGTNGRFLKPGHGYALLQRVIKKNDSHEDALDAAEIQNASDRQLSAPLSYPALHLTTHNFPEQLTVVLPQNNALNSTRLNWYFRVISRMRP